MMRRVWLRTMENVIVGMMTLPVMLMQIWIVNVCARVMYMWGWLNLDWLQEALK